MKNLFTIFFLFLTFNMFSQYNDVKMYFNDSTSIEGLGFIRKDKVYFKLEEKEEFSEWGFESVYKIDFFGFEKEVRTFEFVYSSVHRKFKLMELVIEGEVNLYKLEEEVIISNFDSETKMPSRNMLSSKEYFVKHKKDTVVLDILFGFKKKIARFFSDCPDIIEMVNDKTFSKDDIELIVIYYNKNCSAKNKANFNN